MLALCYPALVVLSAVVILMAAAAVEVEVEVVVAVVVAASPSPFLPSASCSLCEPSAVAVVQQLPSFAAQLPIFAGP